MTRYLTGNRHDVDFSGFQDGGEAFGDMIADASRPDLDRRWTGPDPETYAGGKDDPLYLRDLAEYNAAAEDDLRRSKIAANFMVGYQDGLDGNDGPLDGVADGENVWGHASSRLRSWAGTILAPHLDGIAKSLSLPPDSNSAVDSSASTQIGMRSRVKFNASDVRRFLSEGGIFEDLVFDTPAVVDAHDVDNPFDDEYAGGRRPAIEVLRMAAQSGYSQDLARANTALTHVDQIRSLKEAGTKWATLTNAIYSAPAEAEAAAARAMDRQNQLWQAGVGLVIDAISGDNFSDNKIVKWIVNQGLGQSSNVLGVVFPTNNAAQVGPHFRHYQIVAGQSMMEALYTAFADSGTLMDKDGNWIDLTTLIKDSPDVGRFVDENGELMPWSSMTEDQKSAFENYVGEHTDYADVSVSLNSALADAHNRY